MDSKAEDQECSKACGPCSKRSTNGQSFAKIVKANPEGTTGRTLPVTQLNIIAGLDVAALKADATTALIGLGNGSYPTKEIELAVSEIADAEYDGTAFGAPGYSEAWFQAMGCAAVFRQFGLYDSYG